MTGKVNTIHPFSQRQPDASERRALFQVMLRIRIVEERIAELYPEHEIRCPTHLCIGQEAVPAGISVHLRRSDLVFSSHRSHGHYLAKGGDLRAMMAELYGRTSGCALGKGGSQHLVDVDAGFMGSAPILASTIAVAVGAAWGAVMQGQPHVVVAYFGDAAVETGAFHEAMNFAGTKMLPIVFVCENNLFSVHSSLDVRQPQGRSIHELGPAHGVEGFEGDGNDVEEVWRMGGHAVEKARAGKGPSLLEFHTYRWKEHVGPHDDWHLGYRSMHEFKEWQERCPVACYRRALIDAGNMSDTDAREMTTVTQQETEDAVRFAKESPFPPLEHLHQNLYPGTSSQ